MNVSHNSILSKVASHFQIHGDFLSAEPYGTGHINDTYAVYFDLGGSRIRYIAQRINDVVFADPPSLMENVVRVTDHLRRKLATTGSDEISRRAMTVIPTRDGADFHRDEEGRFWRFYVFIEKARTYDTLDSPTQAYEAGRAFGRFQRMLVDLPGPPLHETVPGFHDGPRRLAAFRLALENDPHNRAAGARDEITFVERHASTFDHLPALVASGELPLRNTHNDCKINNVMIDDESGEGICVIDLDTLMPGLALYDFGDMVRTSTCRAAEDTLQLESVGVKRKFFERLATGYLSEASEFLTSCERDHLVFAGKLITLIIGTRFLTDHLAGDVYFKIHRPGHNLDRCRTQLRMVDSILRQEGELEAAVREIR
jgi:hypothetical protein